MATIKSYTDLSQSQTLSKILPFESADFGWNVFVDGTTRILPIDDWDLTKDGDGHVKFYHAWSLAALLEMLNEKDIFPEIETGKTHFTMTTYIWNSKNGKMRIETTHGETLIDACVAMLEKLNELRLLRH